MLFNRKDIFKIVLPLFVEQLLAVTIGMLDSIMVASAGEAAVSGVSLVDAINLLLSYIFSALATGGSVVCSQFLGQNEEGLARKSAKQLLYSIFFTALVLTALSLAFRLPILRFTFGKIEADVMSNAQIYFLFTAMSYPFLALYNGGAALFRSMGNSKISMTASLIMNLLNFFGNALLIFGFGLGAAGAAISTLFSRIVGSVIMLVLLNNRCNVIYIEKLFRFRPDFRIIGRILGIGIPSGLENGMFQIGKLMTQSLISTLGTAAIAANAVAGMMSSFEYAVGGAVGITMITVVGRCIGAGERGQAKYYAKYLLGIEYVVMLFVASLLMLLSKPIIAAYNLSPEAGRIAFVLIILHSILSMLIWPIAFTLPNTFRAASDVRFTMVVSIISMWIFRIGGSYLFVLGGNLGVLGVWLAMFVDWFIRCGLFAWRFVGERWLTKYKPLEIKKESDGKNIERLLNYLKKSDIIK